MAADENTPATPEGDAATKARWMKEALNVDVTALRSHAGTIKEVRPNRDSAGAGTNAAAAVAQFRAARSAWQAAIDAVGGQINALAKILQGSDDPDLQKIANTGLMTVTGGYRTKMTAALMDLGDGDVAKLRASGAKAAGFADKLRAQIEQDERVVACDDNEFGISVSIAATLGSALGELSRALRDAAKA